MKRIIFAVSVSLISITGVANAFSDIVFTDKVYPATQYLNARGIIKGYTDNTFKPDTVINRAEAVKIILSAAEIPVLESVLDQQFNDVPDDAWFAPFVDQGLSLNIITPKDKFEPAREVNRAEFLKMMCLALQVDPAKYTLDRKSVDVPDDAWFAPYVNFAVKFDILDRETDQKAFPNKSITRREAADILFRTLQKGHALRVQTLLDLTENQLIATLQFLELQKLPEASLSISMGERFIQYSLELLPNNTTVLSAKSTTEAVKNLVGAYVAGTNGQLDDVITASQKAWQLAEEAGKLNEKHTNMTQMIQTLAHDLAAKAREEQVDSATE